MRATEVLQIRPVIDKVFPFTEALRMMRDGDIVNAHTLLALQWLQLHREQVREQWC